MLIESATRLQPGARVTYPADRGNPAGSAVVRSVGTKEHKSIRGVPYVWVGLAKGGVWPSNRLRVLQWGDQ